MSPYQFRMSHKMRRPVINFSGMSSHLVFGRILRHTLPFVTYELGILSIPVTVFWVVAITNAINLLDGLDGLAAGTTFIVSLSMFSVALLQKNIGIALISIALAGSILGFLKYNFHPASIFLGDSGSYFLGFILSVLSLMSSLKGTTTFAILIPIIALGLPIMDTLLAMLRRLLQSLHIMEVDGEKNEVRFLFVDGWSMFRADRGHIHHRLLQIGLTHRNAVMLLYAVSIILGGLAISSIYFKNINYALLLITFGIAVYVGVRRLGYSEVQILRNGSLLPFFNTRVVNRRFLRVFVDIVLISLAYYFAFWLRFEGDFAPMKDYYLSTLPLVLAAKIMMFHFTGLYRGAWRYTNISDMIRMVKAVVLGCILAAICLKLIPRYGITSRAALLIDFNLLLFFVIGARSSFRILEHLHAKEIGGSQVLIYGVGKSGAHALNEFIDNPRLGLKPIGFIDNDIRHEGKKVNGYPVLGTLDSLEVILRKNSITEIIVTRDDISLENLHCLFDICNSFKIPLRRFQTRLEDISTVKKQI